MLLGPRDFIAQAAVWQRRHGGNLYTLLPNVVTAAMQLDARLARMPLYLQRARELALALRELPGVRIVPDPPHINLFHVVLDLPPEQALAARRRVAREHGIWLFGGLREGFAPGTCRFELYIGETALTLELERVRQAMASLLAR